MQGPSCVLKFYCRGSFCVKGKGDFHEECQVEDPEFNAWCDTVIENLEEAKKRINRGRNA